MSTKKNIRTIKKWISKNGFRFLEVTSQGNTHIRFYIEYAGREFYVVVSASPSDRYALTNVKRDIMKEKNRIDGEVKSPHHT